MTFVIHSRFARTIVSALAFGPFAAFAADLPAKTAPEAALSPVAIANWSGPYAGAFVGGGMGAFSTSQGATKASSSGFGFASGALVGYNWQNGPFVFGLDADIGYNVIRAKFAASPNPLPQPISRSASFRAP